MTIDSNPKLPALPNITNSIAYPYFPAIAQPIAAIGNAIVNMTIHIIQI